MSKQPIYGKVILASAGPGDPELVTVKTARWLAQADIVLTDRLVSQEILSTYVNKKAEIIYVGKQCRRGISTPQQTINELLVEYAAKHQLVVRLKGGDTSIFSNVLDELETLVQQKIPYEIVPGVTAALGAAAYAGIPLTARGLSVGVRLLTYYKSDIVANETWKELSQTDDTLVFYMSGETLPTVVEQLTAHGIDAAKKLAVIEQATTPLQQIHTCDLYKYAELLKDKIFRSPSLVIIGKVVALHEQFAWLPNIHSDEHYFAPLTGRLTQLAETTTKKDMLAEPKLKIVRDFIGQFSKEELIWVNGYLAGLIADPLKEPAPLSNGAAGTKKITIAYGTETGNSKKLATDFAAKAKKKGIPTKLVSLDQYKLAELPKEEYFITVISTQGDGEPPVTAQKFYDHIHNNGFKLPQLKYGVLALGDTAYPLFCKTGEDVDKQLQQLGAQRIANLQKCDLDYEETAEQWFDNLIKHLESPTLTQVGITAPVTETKKVTGKQYYDGIIQTNINLTASGSAKKIYHIELLADGVEFLPGDSIGIVPENDALLIDQILQLVAVDGNKTISWKNETATIRELMFSKINISYLLEKSVKHYATVSGYEIVPEKTDLLSLLKKYPLQNPALFEQVLDGLTQIVPRIYNIASSPAAHSGEVHITVLRDVFKVNEKEQTGLCTQYIEHKQEGDKIRFFIQTNKRFRLPAADKDIIMIGPGTGIAPFRSFVAERDTVAASGRNWLFFSEENFTTDFLYQTEWQSWFETETLTKVSLAFKNGSDTALSLADKIILQGKELFAWLQQGAFLYLCGEKEPAGKAIEEALLKVFSTETGSEADGKAFFETLKKENRYAKDLY